MDVLFRLTTLVSLLTASPGNIAVAGEPYGFDPPDFLEGPVISRAATGNTYSFHGTGAHPFAALQLTRVELPPGFSQQDVEFCAQAFLTEIEKRSREFFWQRSKHPLETRSHRLQSWRWSGILERGPSTGVVSCGEVEGGFIAITFEDQLRLAPDSFPAIRSRLDTLEFE